MTPKFLRLGRSRVPRVINTAMLALQLTTALSYAPRPLPLAARCQSLSMSASRNNNIEVNWQKLVNSGDADE